MAQQHPSLEAPSAPPALHPHGSGGAPPFSFGLGQANTTGTKPWTPLAATDGPDCILGQEAGAALTSKPHPTAVHMGRTSKGKESSLPLLQQHPGSGQAPGAIPSPEGTGQQPDLLFLPEGTQHKAPTQSCSTPCPSASPVLRPHAGMQGRDTRTSCLASQFADTARDDAFVIGTDCTG